MGSIKGIADRLRKSIAENGLGYCLLYALRQVQTFEAIYNKTHKQPINADDPPLEGVLLANGVPLPLDVYKKAYSVKTAPKSAKNITSLICEATNNRLLHHKPYQGQIDTVFELLKAHWGEYSPLWFEDMEKLAIGGGLYRLAGELRICHMQRLVAWHKAKNRVRPRDVVKLFWSYLSDGDADAAFAVLAEGQRRYRWYWGDTLDQLDYVFHRQPPPADYNASQNRQIDERFRAYIADKDVAVVGPAKSGQPLEVKGGPNTCVVYTTYGGKERHPAHLAGLPVNVSYYRYRPQFVESLDDKGLADDLDWIIVINKKLRAEKTGWEQPNLRVACKIDRKMLFSGLPQLIQAILMDLLPYKTGAIKLHNVNFYLASTPYHEGYRPAGRSKVPARQWYTFSNHNIISQFEFVKALRDQQLIECDPACGEVLSLDLREYLSRLEALDTARYAEQNAK